MTKEQKQILEAYENGKKEGYDLSSNSFYI